MALPARNSVIPGFEGRGAASRYDPRMFAWPIDSTTSGWLASLAAALGGGLLVLHGFGKAKGISERMLAAYGDLLRQAREESREVEAAGDESSHESGADSSGRSATPPA